MLFFLVFVTSRSHQSILLRELFFLRRRSTTIQCPDIDRMSFGIVDETRIEITDTVRCVMFGRWFAVGMKEMLFIEDQIEILDGFSEKEGFHSIVQLMIFDVFQLEKINLRRTGIKMNSPKCIHNWFCSTIRSLRRYPRPWREMCRLSSLDRDTSTIRCVPVSTDTLLCLAYTPVGRDCRTPACHRISSRACDKHRWFLVLDRVYRPASTNERRSAECNTKIGECLSHQQTWIECIERGEQRHRLATVFIVGKDEPTVPVAEMRIDRRDEFFNRDEQIDLRRDEFNCSFTVHHPHQFRLTKENRPFDQIFEIGIDSWTNRTIIGCPLTGLNIDMIANLDRSSEEDTDINTIGLHLRD